LHLIRWWRASLKTTNRSAYPPGVSAVRFRLVGAIHVERLPASASVWTLTFACTGSPTDPLDPNKRELIVTTSEDVFRTLEPQRDYSRQELGALGSGSLTNEKYQAGSRPRAPKYGLRQPSCQLPLGQVGAETSPTLSTGDVCNEEIGVAKDHDEQLRGPVRGASRTFSSAGAPRSRIAHGADSRMLVS